jgi:hypothetical protein
MILQGDLMTEEVWHEIEVVLARFFFHLLFFSSAPGMV